MSSTPCFQVEQLTITTPDGVLLEDVNFEVHPGEVILLIGGIGSGKSTLLKLLAGLIGGRDRHLSVSGRLVVGEKCHDLAQTRMPLGGYVFQNHAMFDELSALDNVAIARDHAQPADTPPASLGGALMAEFAQDWRQAYQYSGGQQQSIAITRTLFSGHMAIFYDEPNSGLDLKQTQELAALIKTIATATKRPAIVVAHHIQHLLPQADRVLAINSATKRLIALPTDAAAIEAFFRPESESPSPQAPESGVIDPQPRTRLRWAVRYFAHYFVTLLFSPTMVLYMILCGLLAGFVSTWFLFQHFPFSQYLTPLLHDNTVEALGFVQFRVLVPLLTALLIASRNSAIISAD